MANSFKAKNPTPHNIMFLPLLSIKRIHQTISESEIILIVSFVFFHLSAKLRHPDFYLFKWVYIGNGISFMAEAAA